MHTFLRRVTFPMFLHVTRCVIGWQCHVSLWLFVSVCSKITAFLSVRYVCVAFMLALWELRCRCVELANSSVV